MEACWNWGLPHDLVEEIAEVEKVVLAHYNGDVAILTYNYIGLAQKKDGTGTEPGKIHPRSCEKNDKWMLVHANFAADPLP